MLIITPFYTVSSDLALKNVLIYGTFDTSAKNFSESFKIALKNSGITLKIDKSGYHYSLREIVPEKNGVYKYRPVYLSPEDLALALSSLSNVSYTSDAVLVVGDSNTLSLAKQIIAIADQRRPNICIQAYIYASSKNSKYNNALNGIANVIKGLFSFDFNANVSAGHLSISSSNLTALIPVLDSDTNLIRLSSPRFCSVSGKSVSFRAGQQVPVLTSTSSDAGVIMQSIEYRDSGLSWDIMPVFRGNRVYMDLTQSDSDFIETTTGVNNTPTLNNRSVTTSLSVKSGETVFISGYSQSSEGHNSDKVAFFKSNSNSLNKSDYVLMMSVFVD